jgi:photosynthetic reaction center cytochrome c subunit
MKFLTPAIAIFGLCAVLSAQPPALPTSTPRAGSAGAAQTQMADAVFKNVQVLKGIPVDQFLGTMGLFAAALSADCSGCHTGAGTEDPKWEDDTPRKLTARRMIAMVQTINKDNFSGRQQVTCWTCHRGNRQPLVTPTLDRMYGEPVFDPPDIIARATSGEPTTDQIFDKYIQALGGAERLAALKSYAAKGTSIPFGDVGKGFPTEIYAQAPNKLVTLVHAREGDMSRSFDGTTGYFLLPLTVVEEYPWTGGGLEGAKLDAEMAFPGGIKNYLTNWRVGFSTTIDGKDVHVVQGTGPAGLMASFYFDKESGLLLRMQRYFNSPVGRVPTQLDFADYRAVGQVKMPFKYSYSWLSGRDEFTITDVQPNVTIDPAKFAKPTPVSRKIR